MKTKKKNLRQKLIPAFIAAACIPIAVFALISQARLRKSTLENLNMQAEADLQKADQCLNMTLDKYETILYDITTDEEFLKLALTAWLEKDIMEADAYALRKEFSHICNRNGGVDGIQLVLQDRRRIYYDRLSSSSVNSAWIAEIDVPQRAGLVIHFADGGQAAASRVQMFHIARRVVDYWDIRKQPGYVILSVNMDAMSPVMNTGNESLIYLAEKGIIIGAADETVLGQPVSVLEQSGMNSRKINNVRSGWDILLLQPVKNYRNATAEQAVFWFLVAAAVLAVFVFLIYRVTRPVMISVNEVVEAMESLEKNKFRTSLPVHAGDSMEVQRISEGFNEMAERTRMLIEQVKASAIEQKNAEISALEAQIDPHFLYNILDTINWKAIENEEYEISDMLVALADILRYAINDAGELTTIREEQIWLGKYVLLHQAKLGEEIDLEFRMEEDFSQIKIHKMLLQPFIENAVKYGFRGHKGSHKLLIRLNRAGTQLHILIENNGNPMENGRLKELNDGNEMKNHLGVSNVRKRLKLYYGDDAAVYFESFPDMGTKVHLFVPLLGEMEDEDCGN